ncbi:MAG: TerC family protein [Actinobacteria bacterium]|nr:TerC family protein [Thermoleophilia bacterium]MCB9011335.1 TerC family protein [Actinomycetota bacterium]
MTVPTWVWIATITGIVGLLVFDLVFHVRSAHTPSIRESATWTAIYASIGVSFGLGVLSFGGRTMGTEFFAGYLTELALSVDNLFVFLIIMSTFRVPRADQQKALLVGIVFSLIARGGFIFLGAALINRYAWVFYLFGFFLLLTAGKLLRPEGEGAHAQESITVRLARRLFRTSEHYDSDRLFTVVDGKRVLTPMILVMAALGLTDVMFALDSIPAIFGLTQNTFIVFTATAFSLMGLRQLYFLIDGLLDRLIYLGYGLAGILGFIGVKLILHALHENNVPFINDGRPVHVAEVSIELSLIVIVSVLAITVTASLMSPAGRAQDAVTSARHHAEQYLDTSYETDLGLRRKIFESLENELTIIQSLPVKYRERIQDEDELMELIGRALALRAERLAARAGMDTPPT